MAYYLKSGTTFRVSSKESMDLHESLPVGNYTVKQDQFGNFFLETIESFEIKGKLYGNTKRDTQRILTTFQSRSSSTGVMLTGEKGSGKSLLAKNACFEAAKLGIPSIIINTPFHGDEFNSFMQKIDQPCIVLFDEFEKVYDSDKQESLLTLLDGVFPSKKLFMLTCNDKWRVDVHMRNRPGRIFYMIDFKGVDAEFIREYCNDNLLDKSQTEPLVQIAGTFDQFNFDMLKAAVEEMNRYNESPQEALSWLNARPEYAGSSTFTVKLFVEGKEIEPKLLENQKWEGNPLTRSFGVDYKVPDESSLIEGDGNDFDYNWENQRFAPEDLKKIEGDGTRYIFSNEDGAKVVLSKVKTRTYSYLDALS